jgi:hypothetical protein
MPDGMKLRRAVVVSISGGNFFRPANQFRTIFESNAMKRDTVSANHGGRMFRPLASG